MESQINDENLLFPIFADNDLSCTDVSQNENYTWLRNESSDYKPVIPSVESSSEISKEVISYDWEKKKLDLSCSSNEEYHCDEKSIKKRKKHKKHEKYSDASKNDDRFEKKPKKKKKKHKKDDKISVSLGHRKSAKVKEKIHVEKNELFYMDYKGDPDTLVYGSAYSYEIPKYKPITNAVLVLNDSKNSKERGKKSIHGDRYFYKENKKLIYKAGVSFKFKKGPMNELNNHCLLTTVDAMEESLESDSDATLIRKKNKEFGEYLQKHPNDLKAWFDFLNCQDVSQVLGIVDLNTISKEKVSDAMNDIKISIVEKAIENNPSNLELKIHLMHLRSKQLDFTYSNQIIIKEWKKLLFLYPNSALVWWHYIQFLKTNVQLFSVSYILKAYEKCLSTFLSIKQSKMVSHDAPVHLEERMTCLFMELCFILYQAGHYEKSTAICQAMIELNLFCPSLLEDLDFTLKLDMLEAFWDVGVARFGENNATGWHDWLDKRGNAAYSTMYSKENEEEIENDVIEASEGLYNTWCNLEYYRSSQFVLAWKPNLSLGEDDEDCEDPERLILFEDIKSCVFPLSSKYNMMRVFFTFLTILGVNVHISWPSDLNSWFIFHHFFMIDFERSNLLLKNIQKSSKNSVCTEMSFTIILNSFKQMSTAFDGFYRTLVYLSLLQWFEQYLDSCKNNEHDNFKKISKNIRKEAKAIMADSHNRDNLIVWEAYAHLEMKVNDHLHAHKVYDMMLSNVTDLMYEDDSDVNVSTIFRIYKSSVEFKMYSDQNSEIIDCDRLQSFCLYNLYHPVLKKSYHPFKEDIFMSTLVLKARQRYQSLLDSHISRYINLCSDKSANEELLMKYSYIGHSLLNIVICYAYFQYWSVNIGAALSVFDQFFNQSTIRENHCCDSRIPWKVRGLNISKEDFDGIYILQNLSHEILTISRLKLIEFHVYKFHNPLSVLKNSLLSSLHKYPDQPLIVDMFLNLFKKGHIRGEMRRKLKSVSDVSSTPLLATLVAMQEIKQLLQKESVGDETNKQSICYALRAWFESNVTKDASCHCPLFWRLYMLSEYKQNQKDRIKSIFYRAIQSCPWSKMLYMDAISYIPEMLEEINDVMIEKELRIYVPIEEAELYVSAKKPVELEKNVE